MTDILLQQSYQRYPLGKKYRAPRSKSDLLPDTFDDQQVDNYADGTGIETPWDSFMSLEQFAGLSEGNLNKYRLEKKRRHQLPERHELQNEVASQSFGCCGEEEADTASMDDDVCRDLFGRVAAYKGTLVFDAVDDDYYIEKDNQTSQAQVREFPSIQHLEKVLKGSESPVRQRRNVIMQHVSSGERRLSLANDDNIARLDRFMKTHSIVSMAQKLVRSRIILQFRLSRPLRECVTALESVLMGDMKCRFTSHFSPSHSCVIVKSISRSHFRFRYRKIPMLIAIREHTANEVSLTFRRTSKMFTLLFHRAKVIKFAHEIQECLSSWTWNP
eukprot:Plantae.Rhodophyta-Hildenbrandia_rubra.ctg2497.p1 GENE.Plantae.Rhodophyta-Hildenbrandia_rubra.ctg2497~~Plantae.Rhodophyta-Hildenbrandia_rubra.ctg2497.p1  ORF type:complete len:330 (-),score=30.88 Plantae.Rhodophyta-Hildenbrandia_rubra.ctg2497:1297-2286(-)